MNDVKKDVMKEVKVENGLKIREDLNDMVQNIRFKRITTSYGEKRYCELKLFNNKTIEFKDSDGLFNLLDALASSGEKDYIVSKKLVECLKEDEEGTPINTYVCIEYVVKIDGKNNKFKLFPSKFIDNKTIDVYYKLFKNKVHEAQKENLNGKLF